MNWRSSQDRNGVTCVYIDLNSAGVESARFLLRSDVHFDNVKADHVMEMRHLRECLETGAGVLDFGDLFDAMQSSFDKRQSKSELRDEHKRSDYFNALIESAYARYADYASCFVMMSRGNHETKMIERAGVDLTGWLVDTLNTRKNTTIAKGGYTGWVRFFFRRCNEQFSRRLWYTHGYGGGGEVTKNVIQLANRMPVYIENADIFVCGHTHNQWWMIYPRLRLNDKNRVERRDTHFVQLSTYKDEYSDGSGGFAVERGHSPRPVGAWWMNFRYSQKNGLEIDFQRAT